MTSLTRVDVSCQVPEVCDVGVEAGDNELIHCHTGLEGCPFSSGRARGTP